MASPRVLVISHNVFSDSTAMGKSMISMLGVLPKENLAQLYFHSEVPTVGMCENYFRVRDQDVLKSIFTGKCPSRIYKKEDVDYNVSNSRTDQGIISKIYQFSRRRTPFIYYLRNLIWKLGKWKSEELDHWIRDFTPDLIFFASGDYSFAYRVTHYISNKHGLPVMMWCGDDFFIGERFHGLLGRYYHKDLMNWVEKLSKHIKEIIVISDKMKEAYKSLFSSEITVMRISAKDNPYTLPLQERQGILYAGGLGVNRIEPLLEIAKVLAESKLPGYEYIDVYTGDRNKETLSKLTKKNGFNYRGRIDGENLPRILGKAKFLLHIEDFQEKSILRTKYSLSTKIGESLKSGAYIIAYGPSNISSIEYLHENEAAIIIKNAEDIINTIKSIENNQNFYSSYIRKTNLLAEENHNQTRNNQLITKILRNKENGYE